MSASQFYTVIKAREMFKSLGGRVAGGYLRNRGFTLVQALKALGLPDRFSLEQQQ